MDTSSGVGYHGRQRGSGEGLADCSSEYQRPQRSRRLLIVRALVAFLILDILWSFLSQIGGLFGFKPPLTVFAPEYRAIVFAIEYGRLKPDEHYTVHLPWSVVSPDGRVFAERKVDGRLFVFFPTWYGRGDDLQGYMWCSKPLQSADGHGLNEGDGRINNEYDICGQTSLEAEHVQGAWWWVHRRLD